MEVMKLTLLLLNLHWAAYGFGILPLKVPKIPMISKAYVKIVGLEVCETTDIPTTFEAHLDTIRDDDKAVSFSGSLPMEIDEKTTFSVVADKWQDDEWFLNFYQKDGELCKFIETWLPNAWKAITKAVTPSMEDHCPYAPGNYSVENLEIDKDVQTFPSYLPGIFRANLKVFNADGEDFVCVIITIDIS